MALIPFYMSRLVFGVRVILGICFQIGVEVVVVEITILLNEYNFWKEFKHLFEITNVN